MSWLDEHVSRVLEFGDVQRLQRSVDANDVVPNALSAALAVTLAG
jgi:hypothetical protein